MKSSNKIVANAMARNAKFKVGDKVVGTKYPLKDRTAVVTKVVKGLKGVDCYELKMDDTGKEGGGTDDGLELVNSRACNAVAHHNFKVGDEVYDRYVYSPSKYDKLKIVKIDGDKITCKSVFAGNTWDFEANELRYWDKRYDSHTANSRNPIVVKALNAASELPPRSNT